MRQVVVDTNVFVSALRSDGGANRKVLRLALQGVLQPLLGNALWLEYLDVLGRNIWEEETTPDERLNVLAALAHKGRWITIHYGWRPNLPDESDNHLMELALAGNADWIVTHNAQDLPRGELRFAKPEIIAPAQCLKVLS